ncbi:hypothetical protein ACFQ7F_13020 [Streptomyces sp. NPDC056486]|uniref:deoxynucleotide monophosphate kinase family protein n=1 Tax=Streptomyces sp. NPDC056486 TaxID=3345835 RepID=UPI0036B7E5E6
MSYKHIALLGKAGAGKDTIADRLTKAHLFTRVAFADPLKVMALRIDPFIPTTDRVSVRLSRLVADTGWDYAKRTYPEVRRILQECGQTVRGLEPSFWLDLALAKIDVASTWNLPVVVTDVRYRNEAEALRNRGFLLVRVVRDDAASLTTEAAAHDSETELDDLQPHRFVFNVGTRDDLNELADLLVTPKR